MIRDGYSTSHSRVHDDEKSLAQSIGAPELPDHDYPDTAGDVVT